MEIESTIKTPLMKKYIHQSYLTIKKINNLKNTFKKNKPFPHLELKNFFNQEKAIQILQALAREQFSEKEADLFKFMQTNDFASTKNVVLKNFRTFLSSSEFISYMHHLIGLPLKPHIIDMHATLYQDTDFLLCHDDQLEGRKIAFLLYLSNLDKKDGGSLNFFSSKNKLPHAVIKKIIPQFNAFVFFEVSPFSFHEVQEVMVQKQRIALGGWFHG